VHVDDDLYGHRAFRERTVLLWWVILFAFFVHRCVENSADAGYGCRGVQTGAVSTPLIVARWPSPQEPLGVGAPVV